MLKQELIIRNSKLCEERDETCNSIVNEFNSPVQMEYKTNYDWMVKIIHWDLSRKLNSTHSTKFYRDKTESIQEKEMHSLVFWNTNGPPNAGKKTRPSVNLKK